MTETHDSGLDALLAAAREDYARSLRVKAADIEALLSREEWVEARRAAHKLRGSAAIYGFASLGLAAEALEEGLLAANGSPDAVARQGLGRALSELWLEALRASGEAP